LKNRDIIFVIKSDTVNLDNYTIKDVPGSSGRLDVISRCILSALLNNNKFDLNCKIWVFLKGYNTLKFDPSDLIYSKFPKNELLLADYIVKLLQLKNNDPNDERGNPLISSLTENITIMEYLKRIKKTNKDNIFVLKEEGKDFFNGISQGSNQNKLYFIIGNQCEDFINSKEFLQFNFSEVSLGKTSYLASQVVRLIKLNINYFL